MKVWIIDDDLVSRFATQYGIQQASTPCTIQIFESAMEVLDVVNDKTFLAQDLPDIILLDLVMPNMDGWQFLDELNKSGKQKSGMRIFILSAFAKVKDRQLAKEHPLVHGYFDKPLSRISVDSIFNAIA